MHRQTEELCARGEWDLAGTSLTRHVVSASGDIRPADKQSSGGSERDLDFVAESAIALAQRLLNSSSQPVAVVGYVEAHPPEFGVR